MGSSEMQPSGTEITGEMSSKQKGWQLDPIKVSEGQKIFGCLFLLFILVAGVVILSIFYRHLFP